MTQKGFTLFELLLVIAIIAAMSSVGLMVYRAHAQTMRLDRTSVEMQQILSAAMAYDTDNTQWPASYPCDNSKEPSAPDQHFIQQYLPNYDSNHIYQNTTSSFGTYYCWGPDTHSSANQLFWVAIPFASTQRQLTLAHRLAHMLPFATTLKNPSEPAGEAGNQCAQGSDMCYVRAEVSPPGAASVEKSGAHVVGVGSCHQASDAQPEPGSAPGVSCTDSGRSKGDNDNGMQLYSINFHCDSTTDTGYVLFIPKRYSLGTHKKVKFGVNALKIQVGDSVQSNQCDTNPQTGNVSCVVKATFTLAMNSKLSESVVNSINVFGNDEGGTAGFISGSYIAYCKPQADYQTSVGRL